MFNRHGDEKLLAQLRATKDWSALGGELKELAQSNPQRLARVFMMLKTAIDSHPKGSQGMYFDGLASELTWKALALVGTDSCLIALKSVIASFEDKDIPELASVLAYGNGPAMLAEHFLKPELPFLDRLQPRLLHEMVMRKHPIRQLLSENAQQRIQDNGPFGQLCCYDLPEETKPALHSYWGGGSSFGSAYSRHPGETAAFTPDLEIAVRMERDESLALAVDSWVKFSNGNQIAWRGSYQGPCKPAGLISRVPELSACTELSIERIAPDEVFGLLHSAAANGGAYGKRLFAAEGRLIAWQNIASLMSLPTPASNVVLAQAMHRKTWYKFLTDNWFMGVAWDIGILCIDEEARRFAIMAGTDTD